MSQVYFFTPSTAMPNRSLGTMGDEKARPSLLPPVVMPANCHWALTAGRSTLLIIASPDRSENEPRLPASFSNATENEEIESAPVLKI